MSEAIWLKAKPGCRELLDNPTEADAPMKSMQAFSGEETQTVWTGAIKRLLHRYLELRNNRRALRRGSAENKLAAPYEGRRWCDATERELIGDITNSHGSHL